MKPPQSESCVMIASTFRCSHIYKGCKRYEGSLQVASVISAGILVNCATVHLKYALSLDLTLPQ